jgi:hypothetical protein
MWKTLHKVKQCIGSLLIASSLVVNSEESVSTLSNSKKIAKTMILLNDTYNMKVIDEYYLHKKQ